MRPIKIASALAWGMAAALLSSGAVRANQQAPGQIVSGYVTAVGGGSITVGGQSYSIEPGSPADDEQSSVTPGQRVDVQLNGPASSPDAQVINIAVHEGE